MEYYSTLRKKESLPYVKTWMENILSEIRSHRRKNTM